MALYLRRTYATLRLWRRLITGGRLGRLGLALAAFGVALAIGQSLWLSAQPIPGPCTGVDVCLEPVQHYDFLGRAVEPDEALGQQIKAHEWDFKYNGFTFGSDASYVVTVDCSAGNCNENCNDHPDPAQAHLDCSLVDNFGYTKPPFFNASNTVIATVALRGRDTETPPHFSALETRRARVALASVGPTPNPSDLKVNVISSSEFTVTWYDVMRVRPNEGMYELNVDDPSTPTNPDIVYTPAIQNPTGYGSLVTIYFTGTPTHTYRAWVVPIYDGGAGLIRRQSFPPSDPIRYAEATLPANATPVITVTPTPAVPPPHYIRPTSSAFTLSVTAVDPEGNSTTLRATTLPPGSTFPSNSSPTGSAASTFTWNPSTGGDFTLALNAFDQFGATTTNLTIRINRGPGVPSAKLASTTPPGAVTLFPSSETVTAEYYDPNTTDRNNAFTFVFDDPDAGDVASAYQFQFASTSAFSPLLNTNFLTQATSVAVGTRSQNFVYLGNARLVYDYEYYWRVRTYDRYSLVSPWSVGKLKVRNPVVPNVAPTLTLNPPGPALSVNRGQTLTVNLTATPPEGTQTVTIAPTGALPSPRMTFTPSGPNATFTFTPNADDLAPASPYNVEFCATDTGTPPLSTCQTVTITVNLNLPAPTGLNVYFNATTNASSTWTYGASETEQGFKLRRTAPAPTFVYDVAANTYEYLFSELACSNSLTADYSLTAFVRKTDGTEIESPAVTRTGVSRPGFNAPTNLVRIPDGPSGATITWQHFADPRPGRSGYVVYDNGSLVATVTSPFQTSANLSGLVPGAHSVVVKPYVDIASCSPSRIEGQASAALNWTQPGLSVKFTPEPFDFEDVELGDSLVRTFEISNDGTSPITFDALQTQDIKGDDEADFSLEEAVPATLAPGASWMADFKFTPSRLGAHTAEFNVYDTTYGLLGTVNLVGNGVPASVYSVSLNPTSLSFGDQQVGTTSGPRPIAVTNNGTVPLVIQAASMTPVGPNAGAFTISGAPPGSLAVGATWTPQFTFSPTTTGANTAQFRVVVQTAGQIATAALTGNGTPATVSDPTGLSAAWPTPNRVRMSWTYPPAETEDGFEASVGGYAPILTVPANATSYDLNVTTCYTGYAAPQTARLRAFRGPAGPSRVYSNTSTADAGVRAGFAAPTGVTTAFLNATTTRVSWSAATTSMAGFNIIRNGTTIGTVGPTATQYTNTPVTPGSYTYGVQPYVTVPGCATPPTGATASAAAYTHPSIAFAATPNPLNVGSSAVGTPITATFNLTNNSSVALTMTLNAFTGPQASAFSLVSPPPSPISFTAGQTRTLTVQFNPTAFGAHSAQLPITYTYGGVTNPAINVDVTGTGTLAAPSGLVGTWIDPETLKFDWTYSGSGHSGFQVDLGGFTRSATTTVPADRTYTWSNLGAAPCYTNTGASHSLSVRAYRNPGPIYSAAATQTLNVQRPGWEPAGSPFIEYQTATTGKLRWTDPPTVDSRYVVTIVRGGTTVFTGTTPLDAESMNVTGLLAGHNHIVTLTPRRALTGCTLDGTPASFVHVHPDFHFYLNQGSASTYYREASSVDLRGVPRFECAKVWGVVRNLSYSTSTIDAVNVTVAGGTAAVTVTPALPPAPFPRFNSGFTETTQWRVEIEVCPSTASTDLISTVKLHGSTVGDVLSLPIRVYSDLDAAPTREVFVTQGTHTGNFGATPVDAMAAADAFCNADTSPARDPSKSYRGLLWFGGLPAAGALEPQTIYTLASTSEFVFGTELDTELPIPAQQPLSGGTGGPIVWTGRPTSTETGSYDCSNWSSTLGRGQNAFPGRNRVGEWQVYDGVMQNCTLAIPIYCVERTVVANVGFGGDLDHGDWGIGIGVHNRTAVFSHYSGDPITVTQVRFSAGTSAEFNFGPLPVLPRTMSGSDSFTIPTTYDPVDEGADAGNVEVVTNELGTLTLPITGRGIWSGKRLVVTEQRLQADFLGGFGDPRTTANNICQADPWAGNGSVSTVWQALLKRGGTWLNPSAIRTGVQYVTGHGHPTPDTVLFTASSNNDTSKPLPVPLGDSARSWVWAGDGANDCLGWTTVNPVNFGAVGTGWTTGWPPADRTQWFKRTASPLEVGCNVSTFPIYCVEQ